MSDKPFPIMMADKLVGKGTLDLETGEFKATIDTKLTRILYDGLQGNLLSISFYGHPVNPEKVGEVQEGLAAYLKQP